MAREMKQKSHVLITRPESRSSSIFKGRRNEATGHRLLMRSPLLKRQPELLELAVGAAELQEESRLRERANNEAFFCKQSL